MATIWERELTTKSINELIVLISNKLELKSEIKKNTETQMLHVWKEPIYEIINGEIIDTRIQGKTKIDAKIKTIQYKDPIFWFY